jgi:hypothetical protein
MLVKYCKPEHNPLQGCKTIRLGTLQYYREMDPSFSIADEHEGKESYSINVVHGSNNYADGAAFLERCGIISGLGANSAFTRCEVDITFPNSYIWCCKQVDGQWSPGYGQSLDKEYTSSYSIDTPKEFGLTLAKALYSKVELDMFTERAQKYITSQSLKLSDLKLQCAAAPVRYVPKKQGMYGDHFTLHYENELPEFYRPAFVKPEKYKFDTEFRYALVFTCPKTGRGLPVKTDPFDMDVTAISKFFKHTKR